MKAPPAAPAVHSTRRRPSGVPARAATGSTPSSDSAPSPAVGLEIAVTPRLRRASSGCSRSRFGSSERRAAPGGAPHRNAGRPLVAGPVVPRGGGRRGGGRRGGGRRGGGRRGGGHRGGVLRLPAADRSRHR